MATIRIHLERTVPESLATDLEKRLFYVSADIEGFTLVRRDGEVEALDLEVASGSVDTYLPGLTAKVNEVVARDVLAQRAIPAKVVWRSRRAAPSFSDVYGPMVATGTVFETGEGQLGFGEPVLGLVDHLDARLRALALDLGAVEYRYPTLLPTSVLDQFGYFGSFPQNVMFVTRLHNDADVYREFLSDYGERGTLGTELFGWCRDQTYCLPPTMCYHTFHQYRNRSTDGDTVVTSKGKAFRYESRYHAGFERLWDFTIREVVFMGDQKFAAGSRLAFMENVGELVDELELTANCEVANDHFFADAATASKISSQRLTELKYELLVPVNPERSIAVGSFNLHGHWFGESFDITTSSRDRLSSACAGFGLERLAYAFLCQHGLDPVRWPASVRSAVG